jgi:HD-like signal output (HDOD) protein
MELNALLASQFVLPSIPQVIALLLNELEQDEPNLMRISQLISTDLALTARLLQLSNSGFFKLSGKINSVSESLAILGLGHVHTMATAAASSVSFKSVPGINLQQFWGYSLNVAKLSRSLSGVVRLNQQAAFTCGLLHAIGELAIHMGMSEAVAKLNLETPALDLRRAKVEKNLFGFSYAEVGAGLTRQWLFPQPIVEALEHQCAPFENDVYEPLAGVIHLATWRARGKRAAMSDKELAVTFPGPVGEVLGLDIDMVLQQDPFDWFVQSASRPRL